MHAHVSGLLDKLLPPTATLEARASFDLRSALEGLRGSLPECDTPFWDRFCHTQMITRHFDGVVAAAREKLAALKPSTAVPANVIGGGGGSGGKVAPPRPPRPLRKSSMSSVSALAAALSQRSLDGVDGGGSGGLGAIPEDSRPTRPRRRSSGDLTEILAGARMDADAAGLYRRSSMAEGEGRPRRGSILVPRDSGELELD
jgi:hypothetical protein